MVSELSPELEQTLALALKLSPVDKLHLVEQVVATLEGDLVQPEATGKRSLYGLWSDVSVSADEIDQVRQETWDDFTRKDI